MAVTVAVIGLGTLGLVAVKDLLEEGFDVTGFDSANYVGGLWQYSPEDKTSVLPTTVPNISIERGSFTDFPFPDDTNSFPSAHDVIKYLNAYVAHFGFASNLRLKTTVNRVSRDEDRNRWRLDFRDADTQFFDKVVVATGMCQKPYTPTIESAGLFEGETLHSSAYKRPDKFKGKRVLAVGLGNTGADTATSLIHQASEVYLSYKHGVYILPRTANGRPGDHAVTMRKAFMQGWFEKHMPATGDFLLTSVINKMQNDAFKIRPEWRLRPAPPLNHAPPVVSDTLIDALEYGHVQPVPGIRKFLGGKNIELDDGSKITVDAVIWCTGYQLDFSILDAGLDPTRNTTQAWKAAPGSKGKPLPRLYQNIFSLDHPQSLAFLGPAFFLNSAMPTYDLAAMAIAQIWKGNSSLPTQQEMERVVEEHHAWLVDMAKDGSVMPGSIKEQAWIAWANDAAGTGVNENLSWTGDGWRFWWRERALCGLVLDGLYTPFVFRLFEGKRKRWEGAREQIFKVARRNEEVKRARRPEA